MIKTKEQKIKNVLRWFAHKSIIAHYIGATDKVIKQALKKIMLIINQRRS